MKIKIHNPIFLLFFYTITGTTHPYSLIKTGQDKTGTAIDFILCDQYDDVGNQDRDVFFTAYKNAYANISASELGVGNKDLFYKKVFDHMIARFKENRSGDFWCRACYSGAVVGFINFEKKALHEVHIRHLAVHPSYQKRGIATQLIRLITNIISDTRQLSLIVRHVNTNASACYQALGFTQCSAALFGYDSKKYQGYRYTIE